MQSSLLIDLIHIKPPDPPHFSFCFVQFRLSHSPSYSFTSRVGLFSPIASTASSICSTISLPGFPPRRTPPLSNLGILRPLLFRTSSPPALMLPPPSALWPSSPYVLPQLRSILDGVVFCYSPYTNASSPELPGEHDEAARWWRRRRLLRRVSPSFPLFRSFRRETLAVIPDFF